MCSSARSTTISVSGRGLEHEPTAWAQRLARRAGQLLGRGRGDEGDVRLPVPHLGLKRGQLVGLDVRGVRDDEIEVVLAEAAREVVLDEPHAPVDPRQLQVLARERECVLGDVHRGHLCLRHLVRDRQRDRARAGTDVEHPRLVQISDVLECPFDDDLGLGSRDQRAPVGLQRQAPEAPLAEDVGERLSSFPADEVRVEGFDLLVAHFPVELGVQQRSGAVVAGLGQQQL